MMTTVGIAMYRRPDGINWPDPDHVMPEPSPPWEAQEVVLNTADRRRVPALVFEEWAVHRMIDEYGFDNGWAMTTHVNGGRLTFGARVFASAAGAMEMCQKLAAIYKHFASFTGGQLDLPPEVRANTATAFEQAERDGKILLDLVTVA